MTVKLDPQWAGRRRVVIGTLVACLSLSVYAIMRDNGSGFLASGVVGPCAILAGAVVGSYCFSAEWGRINGVPSGNVTIAPTPVPVAPRPTMGPPPP